MRKEVLFAIFAGVSIGLILAFGAWKVTQLFKKSTVISDIKKNLPPQNKISLSISNLSDFDIVTTSPFTISGITAPKSAVIVSTMEKDYYKLADNDGSFEIEVEFPAGLSEVKINDQVIKAVYSGEFSKYLPENKVVDENTSTESANTNDSVDVIREKIKDEIAGKSLKKIAFVGAITDISSGTIQIKSIQGDIKQMSLGEDTSYVNTLKKNAEIKSSDLAIGDYIVAMGFINGNKVLDAKRILISEPLKENEYEVVNGKVSEISKTKLVIIKDDNETFELAMPKKWIGPNIADIEEGRKITLVGINNEGKFDLRTIFVEDSE